MEVNYTQTITDSDIKSFACISGDRNPVHMDDNYANSSPFKGRIAHGMMILSYFSALLGNRLPGPGCVYVSQTINFMKPIYIGDTINVSIKVTGLDIKRRRVFLSTICTANDKKVIDGEAEVYIPKVR